MGLLDDLRNAELFERPGGPDCTVCTVLRELDPEISAALREKLLQPNVTNAALSRVLVANGHNIKPDTIGRHRRNECRGTAS